VESLKEVSTPVGVSFALPTCKRESRSTLLFVYSTAPKVEEVKEEVVAVAPVPTPTAVETAPAEAPKSDAADILAMIRSRKTD
jgi:hypothetical protein